MRFREFAEITEVNVDQEGGAWTRQDADGYMDAHQKSYNERSTVKRGGWKALPGSADFPNPSYEVVTRKRGDTIDFGLIDVMNDRLAVGITASATNVLVPGEKFKALQVNTLSAAKEYRGKNLATPLYQNIVDNGTIIISSEDQTPGGKSVWVKFAQSTNHDVLVIVPAYEMFDRSVDQKMRQGAIQWFSQLLGVEATEDAVRVALNTVDTYEVMVSGDPARLLNLVYSPDFSHSAIVVAPKGKLSKAKSQAFKL